MFWQFGRFEYDQDYPMQWAALRAVWLGNLPADESRI